MKSQRNVALFLFVLVGVFTVSNFFNRPIQAALEAPKAAAAETKPEATQQNNKSVSKYDYVAQPGDSYTVLARKAIQTYGIVNKVKLSQAQIIAAETSLTVKAGSPELNEGQKATLEGAAVKSAVEGAQKLSQAQLAEWQVYVADVDFNTNKVGQTN
jgi:hypothetical protein